MNSVRAFVVHLLTASGAALALLALLLAARGDWPAMFLCLGIALFVDAVDGPLARRFKIAEVLPRWSGEALDFVVDFVTYVFVPAYAISASGLLPQALAIPAGLIVVMTGALYFSDRLMKTDDNYFHGFPAIWNVVAFYLFVLKPASWLAVLLIIVPAALTFAPVHFVHPLRAARLRSVNIALLALWAVLAAVCLLRGLDPEAWVAATLSVIAVYFIAAGWWRPRG